MHAPLADLSSMRAGTVWRVPSGSSHDTSTTVITRLRGSGIDLLLLNLSAATGEKFRSGNTPWCSRISCSGFAPVPEPFCRGNNLENLLENLKERQLETSNRVRGHSTLYPY